MSIMKPVDKPALSDAERVSIRMQLADSMLRHAHTVDLDHLQELSAFVLSGRRKKKIVTETKVS